MTKHILDKVAASLRPNSRIADCKRALADAETEHAEIEFRIAEADRNASNPSVSGEDARRAVERADDFRLLKRRLARGIDELRAVIAQKEEARRSDERASAYAAAKAERDALTEQWLGEGASAYAVLMRLIAETHANDQLIAQTNRMLPEGAARLRSAELEARGPMNEERRFTSLEWDRYDRPGLAWSLREAHRRQIAAQETAAGHRVAAAAAAREAANTPQALAAKAKAEAARYSRYSVAQARYSGSGRIRVMHRDGAAGIGDEAAELWMDAAQVSAAQKAGLKLVPAPLKEKPREGKGEFLHTLGRDYGDLDIDLPQVSQL